MDKLHKYHQKRNFQQTQEPKGLNLQQVKGQQKLKFVVQRHHASRLHYDFRLEMDGVLKSWAIPKGPSLNPKDKRLAVLVEDHPLDYGAFEGVIPEGNYGAGMVMIFDEGTYEAVEGGDEKSLLEQFDAGNLKFILHGHTLRGSFALVRIKDGDNNWLLIKHEDAFAVHSAYNSEDFVNESVKQAGKSLKTKSAAKKTSPVKENVETSIAEIPKPMLAKLGNAEEVNPDWIFEKKYDGFRILALKTQTQVLIYSRNGKLMNKLFPSLVESLQELKRGLCLDGELVIEDHSGRAQFQYLQSGEPLALGMQLRYYIFDMLKLDGHALENYTLCERQELLNLWFKNAPSSMCVPVERVNGAIESALKHAEDLGWEGLMAKNPQSLYHADRRSAEWLKIKLRKSQEAVICGYTKAQGSRAHFGALVLGYYKDKEWRYLGNCGTGFKEEQLKTLAQTLKHLKSSKKPFPPNQKVAKEKDVTWVKPTQVCEVYYTEFTNAKHLRHPVFKGLRTDKMAKDVCLEVPIAARPNERTIVWQGHQVKLSNLNKLYWPQQSILKGDMIDYYEQYASIILPYLKDKPISLNRYPNGIEGAHFFQKNINPAQSPEWLQTAKIFSDSTQQYIDYLICNDKATLLYMANLGSIEINPWLAPYNDVEHPDFAVLDLDPNGADFKDVILVAQTAHSLFQQAGLQTYIKTSGSTGLHIYLYVARRYDFNVVRNFIEFIAELIHEQHPKTTSLIRDPQKRKGLIYLDFLQNRRGQTIAAPYSIRPKAGATVSTPLFWEEVKPGLALKDFNIHSIATRLHRKADPWKDLFDHPANLKKALKMF